MRDDRIRLEEGVSVEPMYGDIDVDCRLLFLGDRYRQLLRAFAEAIYRLDRDRPLAEREAYLRSSAEVAAFYDVCRHDDRITLRLHDSIFYEQAPINELDLVLVAKKRARGCTVPFPIGRFRAASVLVHLLNGERSEMELLAQLNAQLAEDDARWARDLLSRWSDAGLLQRTSLPENALLRSAIRPRVTFMGHSSILFQSRETAVLTDPLIRARLGSSRIAFDAARLKLGAVFCSHSHWDHCDITTLFNFDKRTPIVVPRVRKPSAFNPPILPMLDRLGFTDVREIDVWDRMRIGDIEVGAVPFHGEQDEPGAEIDHYTYVMRTDGLSVYGGVDAFRDTYGEMVPVLERVRREWAPDIAFLPVSRMTYPWKYGGVNGFCRNIDTTLIGQSFQYTASPEQAVEWARALDARRVVPYATFNFMPSEVPPQAREFDQALGAAGLGNLLLPLRPFDAAEPADLLNNTRSTMRREFLVTLLRAGAAANRIDLRLKKHLPYRAFKRMLFTPPDYSAHHH